MFKRDGDKEMPEPFAEMARFFTESRLLQQDVKLLIEGVSNQLVMATVIHPVSQLPLQSVHKSSTNNLSSPGPSEIGHNLFVSQPILKPLTPVDSS